MAELKVLNKETYSVLDPTASRESYVFKVVLLGSTAVGKSSLAYRYVKQAFRDSVPTVGCKLLKNIGMDLKNKLKEL